MGHKLSKEAAFIQDLKSSLRERGIRVKKKDLIAFFIFVSDVCPWLIIEGPDISSVSWDKVGRYLNDLLQEKGPNAIPIQVFSYWSIIRDVLRSPSDQKGRLISLAGDFIRLLSRRGSISSSKSLDRGSPCPSTTIDMPNPPETISLKDPKGIYPVLQKEANRLSPSEGEKPREAATHDHNPDWLPRVAASAPPPPSSYLPFCAPAFPTLQAPVDTLLKAREDLSKHVNALKDVLSLQREFSQLNSELSALQREMSSVFYLRDFIRLS